MKFLCIDPRWEGGRPYSEVLEQYDGVRFVAFPDRFDDVALYLNLGKLVQLVIARESGPVEAFYDWFRADDNPGLEAWFRSVAFWVIGNEMDGEGPASWTMTPEQYEELWDRAQWLHGERWVGGLCNGDPGTVNLYAPGDVDESGIVIHPYGKTPQEALELALEYSDAAYRTPVWVGEFFPVEGYTSEDYFNKFAEYGIWANRFCYSSQMVPGFGLESRP